MKKTHWLYMHTIDGHPAYYEKGRQIVYVGGNLGGSGVNSLAASIKQIKLEQKLSREWRKMQRHDAPDFGYGYTRINMKAIVAATPHH